MLYGSDNSDKVRIGRGEATVPELYARVNEVAEEQGTDPLTDAEMAGIMGGNATRLYKLDR